MQLVSVLYSLLTDEPLITHLWYNTVMWYFMMLWVDEDCLNVLFSTADINDIIIRPWSGLSVRLLFKVHYSMNKKTLSRLCSSLQHNNTKSKVTFITVTNHIMPAGWQPMIYVYHRAEFSRAKTIINDYRLVWSMPIRRAFINKWFSMTGYIKIFNISVITTVQNHWLTISSGINNEKFCGPVFIAFIYTARYKLLYEGKIDYLDFTHSFSPQPMETSS